MLVYLKKNGLVARMHFFFTFFIAFIYCGCVFVSWLPCGGQSNSIHLSVFLFLDAKLPYPPDAMTSSHDRLKL